jgi:radical SAM superfamily enzyme YgiQ (UPF0313 family)
VSRIFLISTNTCCSPYPVYPLGMATVASALIHAGHCVHQFDWLVANRDEKLLERAIAAFGPDVVAVSIRNIDPVDSLAESDDIWELKEDRNVIALVRRLTSVPVIIGGPAVSILPRPVCKYVGADLAVVGEGEHSIVDAIKAVLENRSTPPIWSAAHKQPCDQEQSSPCFDESLVAYYRDRSGIIGLQSKRGCPYHCCYCGYPKIEGTIVRHRPVEAVVADLERLKHDFQVDTVFFVDSVFNDSNDYYLKLVEEIAVRNIGIKWAAYMSPHGLTKEAVTLCKRAGLYAVELGTDAATDITLEAMGKPFRWDDVKQTNQLLVQAGVACAHFVIFGGPEETEATVQQGLDNIAGLEHCVVIGFSGIRIYPDTLIHKRALKEGYLRQTDSLLKPVYYISPKVDKTWMDNHIAQSWARRRDRVFPPSKGQRMVETLRALGYKGLLWERIISSQSAQI